MFQMFKDRILSQMEQISGGNIYILLDPAAPVFPEHPLHLGNLAFRSMPCQFIQVNRPGYAKDSSMHPLLLTLRLATDNGYPDEELLTETLSCANSRRLSINGNYVCAWLVSNQSASDLAGELSASLSIWDAVQKKKRFLPWFEPCRLALWAGCSNMTRTSSRLGRISFWNFMDAHGDIINLEAGCLPGEKISRAFEDQFWRLQSVVGLIRRVIAASVLAGIPLPTRAEPFIANSLLSALEVGLSKNEDLVVFALNDLGFTSDWRFSSDVQACIAHAASGRGGLSEALDKLPMNTWAGLKVASSTANAIARVE